MNRLFASAVACLALLPLAVPVCAQTVPQTMSFQGRLAKPDGTPIADVASQSLTVRLYSAATGGVVRWMQTSTVSVHNGVFSAPLDFSTGFQNGATLATTFGNATFVSYLEIQVGSDAPLSPRQKLTSNAYAFTAQTAFSVLDGSITAAKIAPGAVGSSQLASGLLTPLWNLTGNAGTNPASNFLGTMDNQPLVIKVNGHQAMRYQYAENLATSTPDPNDGYRSVNVLGGSEVNSISAGVVGATIAGGGKDWIGYYTDYVNAVTGDFGTVGGGYGNTAGSEAIVGGGYRNQATGLDATIPGGLNNRAVGAYSFAAGQNAFANHDGCFVWNDNSVHGNDVDSTGVNQFLIHATGGVGINTNAPGSYALSVNGTAKINGNLTVNSTTYTSDARYKTNIASLDDALNIVARLRGVTYNWDRAKWPTQGFADGQQIGFLAQEVETALPELVVTDKAGYKSVNYIGVVPILVEAVKTLNNQVEDQRKQTEMQQKQIEALQSNNAELKRQNARIAELEAKLNALLSSRKER